MKRFNRGNVYRGWHGQVLLPVLLALLSGCATVERRMTIQTDPPGALVYLNDQEVGRTPLTYDFTWYGNYDLQIRKEGFQTLSTNQPVIAPWWQWVPFDLAAEMLPLHLEDHRGYFYNLTPATTQPANPQQLLQNARELRKELQGGPTTHPEK